MKLQTVAPDRIAEAGLFDRLSGLAGECALILGLDVEIMCGLIQLGCAAVAEVEPAGHMVAGSADLVILPRVATSEAVVQGLAHAQGSLTAMGRVVVRTVRRPSDTLVRAVPALLRRHGFVVTDVLWSAGRSVFVARRPGRDAGGPGVDATALGAGALQRSVQTAGA